MRGRDWLKDEKISEERLAWIWSLADKAGTTGRTLSVDHIAELARAEGKQLTWREVRHFALRDSQGSGLVFWPDFLVEFLAELLRDQEPQSVLDVAAGTGALLCGLSEAGLEGESVGLIRGPDSLKAIAEEAVSDTRPPTFLSGGLSALPDDKRWDLVVASVLVRSERNRWAHPRPNDDHGGSFDEPTIAAACSLLSERGRGALLVPNGFFFRRGLRQALHQQGLRVDAVFAIPPGSVADIGIELQLALITRGEPGEMFVGRVEPGQKTTGLIANYQRRKPGKHPDLGRLLPEEGFRGWAALAVSEEVEKGLSRSGLPLAPMTAVIESIVRGKPKDNFVFKSVPGAVYLPEVGMGPAALSFAEAGVKKARYCLQLHLKNDPPVSAEYLVGFLNSALGQRVRAAASGGGGLTRIDRTRLLELSVPKPTQAQQEQLVDADGRLQKLESVFHRRRVELWNRPKSVGKVVKELEKIDAVSSFEGWIEGLPYPLASVLWRYHADAALHRKVEHLHLALEATAQLTATLLLSWSRPDAGLWDLAQQKCLKPSNEGGWNRTSFGRWIALGECLSKRFRTIAKDKDEVSRLRTALGTDDQTLLEVLCNKRLFGVLNKANDCRNKWKGHGGAAGDRQLEYRRRVLSGLVTEIAKIIGTAFDEWQILRAGAMDFDGQSFATTCDLLVGSRSQFRQEQVESLSPMKKSGLYIRSVNSLSPVEVAPLVRLMAGPETEATACYFYNRVEGEKVRWVSYHFENEADVRVADPEALSFVQLMNGEV